VLACTAHRVLCLLLAPRTAYRFGFAALTLLLGCESLQTAVAQGDTRSISLHHVHTNEDLTVTYKRNGRYDDEALKKINWLLRDWRRGEEIETDPRLLDIIWEVHREVGAKQAIHVICGYRAPQTNAMLRRRSGGVAQHSQHTLGRAMDFFIPGVPVEELRVVGLRLQRGGIGFYPTSGSPFVHLDVGSVRHWPSMSREELVRVFPDGRTVHVPADGRPLSGYAVALADIERRGSSPSSVSLAAARNAGVLSGDAATTGEKPPRNLLATLFGFGKDEDAGPQTTASIGRTPTAPPSPKTATADAAIAKKAPTAVASVPTPRGRPATIEVAAALPPAPQAQPPGRVEMAFAGPAIPASLSPWPTLPRHERVPPELALAYAAQPGPELTPRPAAMALRAAPLPTASIPAATSVALKQPLGQPTVAVSRPVPLGERFDDPWLRAAILTPSLYTFMTTALAGPGDSRGLNVFMQKPSSSVMMTFAQDPNVGLAAERFSGRAVVFVATTTFNARTAWLQ
jgi:uncharacterized protein YcbK (DUF882 family)